MRNICLLFPLNFSRTATKQLSRTQTTDRSTTGVWPSRRKKR